MPVRIQDLNIGFGIDKQADIATASTTFKRFLKLNPTITTPKYNTENDAAYIGKDQEFATQTFPVSKDVENSFEKYASAEWMTYVLAYALGKVSETTGVYTLKPIVPDTDGLELPYFTLVEQLKESGSAAIDNAYNGCAMEEFKLDFNYGPGRQSAKMTASLMGSGSVTTPSAVSLPGVTAEHSLLSQSMTFTFCGVDYVGAKTIVNGSLGWKNNLLGGPGYFPGSGVEDGAAIRGRLEIGVRAPTLEFSARLLNSSAEYTKLKAQTTGSVSLSLTYDSTHEVTIAIPLVTIQTVDYADADGIATVKVTALIMNNGTDPILTVTAKCGISGIAQAAS